MRTMQCRAGAEWEPLREVMVHEPGIEVFFALLSPSAHLYERFFNLGEAQREHRHLCTLLRESFGVKIVSISDAVTMRACEDPAFHRELAAVAASRLGRRCEDAGCGLPPDLQREREALLSLDERDAGHLLDIIRLNPTLVHTANDIRVELNRPLHNLYFLRDQQACTDRGMVLGRMARREREHERDLTGLALAAIDAAPVMRIGEGYLEGGDVMPAGTCALVGYGSRTTRRGAEELMAGGLGFDEVALVRQPSHPLVAGRDAMLAMHLDTYFNIPAEGVCVGTPALLHAAEVEVFHQTSGGYEPAGPPARLDAYLADRGFEIIEITTLEQLCYASNFLCIRDGECIAPDTVRIAPAVLERLSEKARRNPHKYGPLLRQAEHDYAVLRADAEFFPHKQEVYARGLDMTPLLLTSATGGYGGAHCMTCVLRRG
ncbi:MAG: arginine deiminase family protein [Methanomicrobiaceae archaeon]|nr:arginine deiminase family protein [Methanomicrobiaceae archaeon]